MIDSRERNSADGSLIQKARRQVEIFQSQGTGGRSFQVVRASQWSSSRATDCVFDVPITKPSRVELGESVGMAEEPSCLPRLSLWRTSLQNGCSDLEQLSSLCQQLHSEALNTSRQWWTGGEQQHPPRLENSPSISPGSEPGEEEEEEETPRVGLAERRSNSTEDLSSLLGAEEEATFARDCRARRSLQVQGTEGDSLRRTREHLVAERARRFEGEAAASRMSLTPRRDFGPGRFGSIADNDFVKNDPKHPSKFAQVAKITIQDNGQPAPRRANNKTVVHLRNAASPTGADSPPARLTAIKLEADGEEVAANGLYGMLMDSVSASPKEAAAAPKPVKRVEFCKTEIHFAADSGKVNIVETDGKPPPTNKFRRRRRNNALGAAPLNPVPATGLQQKNGMPLVHFGDTSYEKYIFGGQGKLEGKSAAEVGALADEATRGFVSHPDTEIKERWHSADKPREDVPVLEKLLDNGVKHKGTHTTTVNILGNEGLASPSKLTEGAGQQFGRIQLQFAASGRSLSPVGLSDEEEAAVVSRTTKITVHLPPLAPPLLNGPFANLQSVRLVMRIARAGRRDLDSLFSSLCEAKEPSWSLRLSPASEARADEGDDGLQGHLPSLIDKVGGPFPTTNHVVHKDIGIVSERSPKKNQVVSKDSENNQVLLKIVTTHKPTVARVENDHAPTSLKSRHKGQGLESPEEKHVLQEADIALSPSGLLYPDPQAKDLCDIINGTNDAVIECLEDPTYENIFDAVSDGTPVYENFQAVVQTNSVSKSKQTAGERLLLKKSLSAQQDKLLTSSQERRHKKSSSKSSNGYSPEEHAKIKPDKMKTSRSVLSTSSPTGRSSKHSVHPMDNQEPKRVHKTSSRSSGSRDNSIKRYRDSKIAKEDHSRGAQVKRKSSPKGELTIPERNGTPSSVRSDKSSGTLRSKKPVEVVYQTAVYNMKNEKLSKPSTGKEIKGPRLINDLICGSKMRKPSDNKKIIKTAIVSQNTSKRKETPSTMNR